MKAPLSLLWTTFTLAFIFFGAAETASAAQIRVISANPVEGGLHELAELFTRETGHEVSVEVMGGGALNELLASDEAADVVVGTTASIDQAVSDGRASGAKTNIARVGIGVIVRSGARIPDVATADALRQAALEADGVVYNTAGSGQYVGRMLDQLGVGEEVAPKTARPRNGALTMERMVEGTGNEIGFGLLSEIEGERIQLVGRLPENLQNYTVYDGIVLARSRSADVARDFIRYITTPAARQVFASHGVD